MYRVYMYMVGNESYGIERKASRVRIYEKRRRVLI